MKQLLITFLLLLMLLTSGMTCKNNNQVAYQAISTTEAAVIAANSAFLDSVVTGRTPTNSVPKVEADFNALQLALHAAASVASGGASAPTPPALFVQATTFTNTINSVQVK